MDATPASASNGFDAALKALEDLETSVVQTREESSAEAPVEAKAEAPAHTVEPAPAASVIALSDDEATEVPVAIVAIPSVEAAPPEAAPAIAPEPVADAATPPVEDARPAKGKTKAEAPAPVAAPAGSSRLTKAAIGLGLLSSAMSAAGLVVAERTIVSAKLVVADARERAEQSKQANKLIHDLQLVRDKQIELLQQQQAQLADAPVTAAELQQKMDSLQEGLIKRDPLNTIVEAVNNGQTQTNARFNEFGMKMARVEAALDRGGH